jgi:glycosyltransferase involved in cell wall biosynthesis
MPMASPSFSVVMPAFNTASMIGGAIASVLRQTRGDLELLVVDDGSTDGTAEVVRSFADERIRLLPNGARKGPGAARNLAISEARAPYVSMLDSDDLWLPTYLERIGDAFDRHPDAGLACCGHWTLEEPPGLLRRTPEREQRPKPVRLDGDELLRRLVQRNFFVNSTVTVRRSILLELGGCNSDLPAAVDFDLWLRIAAAGHGAVCVPEALAVYRVRRGSIQNEPRNELRAYEALRTVYSSVAEEWAVPDAVRELAQAQRRSVDRRLEALRGDRPLDAALLALRRRVGSIKRLLLRRRLWYPKPPGEVLRALPLVASLACPEGGDSVPSEPGAPPIACATGGPTARSG